MYENVGRKLEHHYANMNLKFTQPVIHKNLDDELHLTGGKKSKTPAPAGDILTKFKPGE